MNRFFWLLNGALLAVALMVTLAAVRFEPASRPPAADSDPAAADNPRPGKAVTAARLPPRGPSPEMVDQIWKQSLFRPDRGEDGAEGAAAAGESARAADMELVGIGQINGTGAAIILLQSSGGTPFSNRRLDLPDTPGGVTPFGGRRGSSSRRPSVSRNGGARSSGEGNGQTHVFLVNQRVATTGFVVKEIRLDAVVLSRGGEERVLKLDRNDDNSKTRQETATREAVSRVPAAPPPPPVPGGLPTPPGAGVPPPAFAAPNQPTRVGAPGTFPSREERIRTAIEARRRLMEGQQPQITPPRP